MNFTIVISKHEKSIASWKIYEALQRQAQRIPQSVRFLTSEDEIIYVDVSKQEQDTQYFIFASTHRSEKHTKTLTVHPIGNWNKADLGGKERTLCGTSAHLLKIFFQELAEQIKKAGSEYECSLEATHHGPFTLKPALFIEIGSTEEEWQDEGAADIVASTIIEGIKKFEETGKEEQKWKVALAFGGGHYCQEFNKLVLQDKYAIAHICSKYALPHLDEEMLMQAMLVSEEKVSLALLDWKGLAGEKQRLLTLLEKAGLPYEKV